MGRLPLVVAVAFPAVVGCDDASGSATSRRSDQVLASEAAVAPAANAASVVPGHAAAAPAGRRRLCEGEAGAKGRALPKTAASHAEAPGTMPPEGSLASTDGAWTWVNFWAAWCGPCKEEIPRLIEWRNRLTEAGTPMRLVFVSLDDDKRELDAFLAAQPADGLRGTLWLPDGPVRASWLKTLRMSAAPELPEQALVAPGGKVRCFIEGAVEDGDYPEMAAIVRARP